MRDALSILTEVLYEDINGDNIYIDLIEAIVKSNLYGVNIDINSVSIDDVDSVLSTLEEADLEVEVMGLTDELLTMWSRTYGNESIHTSVCNGHDEWCNTVKTTMDMPSEDLMEEYPWITTLVLLEELQVYKSINSLKNNT